jgi:hypothetical protein
MITAQTYIWREPIIDKKSVQAFLVEETKPELTVQVKNHTVYVITEVPRD